MSLKSAFLPVSALLLVLLAAHFSPPATATQAGGVPLRTDWDVSRILPPPRPAKAVAVHVRFQGAHLVQQELKLQVQEAGLAYAVFDGIDQGLQRYTLSAHRPSRETLPLEQRHLQQPVLMTIIVENSQDGSEWQIENVFSVVLDEGQTVTSQAREGVPTWVQVSAKTLS